LPYVDRGTSLRMGRIRQRGTEPEMAVRKAVAALGVRFRTVNRDLPGSPDLANRSAHWVIFVHGCFWHGHRGCRLATLPKRNRRFWEKKFRDNRRRDGRVLRELRSLGFGALVLWGCELAEMGETTRHKLELFLANKSTASSGLARKDRWIR
jgi:DNA mismatch endonuclease (patch repair protein)